MNRNQVTTAVLLFLLMLILIEADPKQLKKQGQKTETVD